MKTFHMYKQRRLGSSLYRTENTDELLVAQQTLTVGELKEALASYPDDTPVFEGDIDMVVFFGGVFAI